MNILFPLNTYINNNINKRPLNIHNLNEIERERREEREREKNNNFIIQIKTN